MPGHPLVEHRLLQTRRRFFSRSAAGLGVAALGSLLQRDLGGAGPEPGSEDLPGGLSRIAPKAKRIIYLFQSGAPSQQDLFDHKPGLAHCFGEDLRNHLPMTERVTGMTRDQARFPIAPTRFAFRRHGQAGAWISELLPHTAALADQLCFIRSMHTEAINHDPAITFFQTGAQLAGRPSLGSWLSYGLGSENANLPAFVALLSRGSGRPNCQPLYDRLWSSGFLPTEHAGVRFMSVGDPVLYLSNPPGFGPVARRRMLDDLERLNQQHLQEFGDPEILARIKAYELAYRMQTSVPELTDFSSEPQSVQDLYGPDVARRGSYAWNALLARRLSERGVRCVQLFHMGWDQHFTLPIQLAGQCRDTDRPSAALVRDLKARGLLDETLVIWGGEFGRTTYCQGKLESSNYGRDHHPRCFTLWMTGGGVRPGLIHGETDDYSYNIIRDPVHVHDLHATMLHLLGMDHERLTFKYQGRNFRLTDVHGRVVQEILA